MHPTTPRRIAAAIGTGIAAAALLLTPSVATAATGTTTVATTDKAGDARIVLRNIPTADLRSAGARIGPDTVTVFFGLGATPAAADIAAGRYTFTSSISSSLDVRFDTQARIYGYGSSGEDAFPSAACQAYFGPAGPDLVAAITGNAATGEISATFSRADADAAATCFGGTALAPGAQLHVDAAGSAYTAPSGGIAHDTAAAGPVTTLN